MDKVEYKIRADEIKALIGEGRFAEAVKIADTIDWKRVKSVAMLCTISDLYKINRRYEESRDVLLMAYDRHPTGRAIVYSLCELAIKMGEFVQAVEYYKEFVRIAPRDTGRYILQYKLYEAQEVSLEERIAVLEEFKKHDYREKWVYELAYLYHRVGLTTECIETCDEMFLWLGDGNYVMKALELKALHEPLSPEQQDRYIRYKQSHGGYVDKSIIIDKDEVGRDDNRTVEIKQPTKEMPPVSDEVIGSYNGGNLPENSEDAQPQETEADFSNELSADEPTRELDRIVYPHISEIKEPSIDLSDYNTMNLQEALAENLKEVIGSEEVTAETLVYNPVTDMNTSPSSPVQPITSEIFEEDGEEAEAGEEFVQTQEETTDTVSDYVQHDGFNETQSDEFNEIQSDEAQPEADADTKDTRMQELFYDTQSDMLNEERAEALDNALDRELEEKLLQKEERGLNIDIKYGGNGPILGEEKKTDNPPVKMPVYEEKPLEDEVPGAVIHPNSAYQMASHFDSFLAQESDGQISMAVEPEPAVEKQITGQISITEYMQNWEDYKKSQQEKQFERVKQLVAEETGDLFALYDEETKAGLQERLEKAIADALKKERHDKASGRGDWSRNNDDVINAAVENVIKEDAKEQEAKPSKEEVFLEETAEMEAVEPEPVAEASEAEATDNAAEPASEAQNKNNTESENADAGVEESAAEPAISETATEVDTEFASADDDTEPTTETTTKAADAETGTKAEADAESAQIATEIADAQDTESELSTEPTAETKPTAETEPTTETETTAEPAEGSTEESAEETPATKAAATPEPDGQKAKRHIGNRELEERVRTMTPEEKQLFGPYIHHKKSRRQIINAIDNLSMDAFSGNAIVTGEEGAGTVNLAKGLIKAVQASDSNFSGKVAKITANTLNKKSTAGIFDKLANGALIIQRAADLEPETVNELLKILQEENKGLIIVMEDTKEDMNRFLVKNPALGQSFNVRVDIEALDDDSLVAYAKQYALEKEYAIDNLGILALHTRISERQTLDHEVTVSEVRDIVDDAIYFAEKRSVGHFVDVIVNKRYDENDMIILREKDFMH